MATSQKEAVTVIRTAQLHGISTKAEYQGVENHHRDVSRPTKRVIGKKMDGQSGKKQKANQPQRRTYCRSQPGFHILIIHTSAENRYIC